MGKQSLESKMNKLAEDEVAGNPAIESPMPKAGPAELHQRVKVEINNETEKHLPPYHKHGEVVAMHPVVAAKFEANNWGKIVPMFLLLACFAFGSMAQSTAYQKLAKVVSNLPTTATKLIVTDTVTNTGTNFLSTGYPQLSSYTAAVYAGSAVAIVSPSYSTVVQVNIHKLSGTVAGTVTLQGSLDGSTNGWSTVLQSPYAATYTFTATDVADQSKTWTVANNPYRFYRVTWTGAGTMAATMSAFIWTH